MKNIQTQKKNKNKNPSLKMGFLLKNIYDIYYMKEKWLELIKWFISSVVIISVTLIIDTGFKEREAGIKEMEVYDKYVEIILKADNIEQRWKLCEYFSIVTPTERLRKRWQAYKDTISSDYYNWKRSTMKYDSLDFGLNNVPLISLNSNKNIKVIEEIGLSSLIQKDYISAIKFFTEVEDEKPGYHNCYEILTYLRSNEELKDSTSKKWNELYKNILLEWSWGISDENKKRFESMD